MRRAPAALAIAIAGLLAPSGCGGAPTGAGSAAPAPRSAASDTAAVPDRLLDLTSAPEKIDKVVKKAGRDAFVNNVRLWSLRDGDRLRATLELARLAPDARPEDEDFRQRIANIGTGGTVRWIDGREVYVRKGNQQSIYVWFRGIDFLILSVSAEYPEPRALLRAALTVKP